MRLGLTVMLMVLVLIGCNPIQKKLVQFAAKAVTKVIGDKRVQPATPEELDALLAKAKEEKDFSAGCAQYRNALFRAGDENGRIKVAVAYQQHVLANTALQFIEQAQKSKLARIGVFEIKDEFGKVSADGIALADKLAAELVQAAQDKVEIVERSRIIDIVDEYDVSDPLSLTEIGEKFGVDGMIVGTIGRRINLRLLEKEDAGIVAAVSEDWFGSGRGLQVVFEGDEGHPDKQVVGLEVAIFGQRDIAGQWVDVAVGDGSVLNSGDLFKMQFASNEDAYMYVLFLDSMGEASILYPTDEVFYASRIKAGEMIELPQEADEWFWLDENTGQETLYFISSLEPLKDIEQILNDMEEAGGFGKMTEAITGYKTRGIGGRTKGKTTSTLGKNGKQIKKVTDLVQGLGTAVEVITINHQ